MQLKGGYKTKDPRLDRLPQFDDRSLDYPVRQLVATKEPRSYTWRCNKWLDQGREGACVGFSMGHELIARPKELLTIDNNYARNRIYKEAQKIDEWPGENYEGTSVLAGAKIVQSLGHFKEYRWAFGIDDLILALGYTGPAVLGVNWYTGMFRTDDKGFIRVSGSVAGGHAILARSVNLRGEYAILRNSWGNDWGTNGDCKISFGDLRRLLQEDGEACIPVGRSK